MKPGDACPERNHLIQRLQRLFLLRLFIIRFHFLSPLENDGDPDEDHCDEGGEHDKVARAAKDFLEHLYPTKLSSNLERVMATYARLSSWRSCQDFFAAFDGQRL